MSESIQSHGTFEPSQRLLDAYVALSKNAALWSGDVPSALDTITFTCANLLDVDRVSVWRLNPERSGMQCLTLHQLRATSYSDELNLLDVPDYFGSLQDVRCIESNDCVNDPRLEGIRAYLERLDIRALLDTSVLIDGEFRAVLSLEVVGRGRQWTQSEKNFVVSVADLIGQVHAVAALRESQSKYKALFDGAGDAIFVLQGSHFHDCNSAAEQMFGLTAAQFKETTPADLSPVTQPDGSDSASRAEALIELAQVRPQRFEWVHRRSTGELFDAEVILNSIQMGAGRFTVGIVRDVTERKQNEARLRQSQRELEYRATHDGLTDLPNRHYLMTRLDERIAESISGLSLLLLDLNNFKDINDTLGHRFGDLMLRDVAATLASIVAAEPATLSRLGGDEFAVLVEGPIDRARDLAARISRELRQARSVGPVKLQITASIGIATFPDHGANSHELLRSADVAMYQAKIQRQPVAVYDPCFDSHSIDRLELLSELTTALSQDQLQLYYQPKLCLKTGDCLGVEALLRWPHPERGMIPPSDFVGMAEKGEIIHALSHWVVMSAIRQIRTWHDLGVRVPVAINLSARDLADPDGPRRMQALLDEYAIPTAALEIEITESSLINDPQRALEVIQQFRALGIPFAIDDFGTGYSSLSYLKRLPVSALKIDRSFVSDMLENPADETIVRSTIALAHSFGLSVIAEGIESAATLSRLSELGCNQAQGYFIARPMPAEQLAAWLENRPAMNDALAASRTP